MRISDLIKYSEWPNASRDAFKSAIPPKAQVYADIFLTVGVRTGVSPLLIDALTRRESYYGEFLRPKGPGGTGDFTPRPKKKRPIIVAPGVTVKEEDGAFVLYPPGHPEMGWGYGLLQWDYISFAHEIANLDWKDPLVNIEIGIKDIFMGKIRFFRLPENAVELKKYTTNEHGQTIGGIDEDLFVRAAVAAYNTGEGNVSRSLRAGRDIDSTTADGPDADKDGDYSRDVIGNALATATKMGLA